MSKTTKKTSKSGTNNKKSKLKTKTTKPVDSGTTIAEPTAPVEGASDASPWSSSLLRRQRHFVEDDPRTSPTWPSRRFWRSSMARA